ncbi:MAG TPA: hypothetical protein VHW00_18335 [Thermoanaerobaculia bacterium]|nr:hypothetical protein [Thermoanaerobaculia bacterium]
MVPRERVEEFLRYYDVDGTWAELFRTGDGYLGTELYRADDTFITIDSWRDATAYWTFRENSRERYEALDRETEGLSISEEHIAESR